MTTYNDNLDPHGTGLAYENGYRDGLLERNAEISNLTAELRSVLAELAEVCRDNDRLAQQLARAEDDCKQLQCDLDDAQAERCGEYR